MGPAVGSERFIRRCWITLYGAFNKYLSVDISTTLKNCVNKRTVQDGTFHFPVFKRPVLINKILPYKNSGTEMLIYRPVQIYPKFQHRSFLDTKLITFARTEIKKGRPLI